MLSKHALKLQIDAIGTRERCQNMHLNYSYIAISAGQRCENMHLNCSKNVIGA